MCSDMYLIPYNANVQKRNNSVEEYDQGKIEKVLKSLFKTTNDVTKEDTEKQCILIGNLVSLRLSKLYPDSSVIKTSVIQEILERELMDLGYYKTLKLFIILGYAKEIFSKHSNI